MNSTKATGVLILFLGIVSLFMAWPVKIIDMGVAFIVMFVCMGVGIVFFRKGLKREMHEY